MSNEVLANKIENDHNAMLIEHCKQIGSLIELVKKKTESDHLYITLKRPVNFRQLKIFNKTRITFKTAWIKDEQFVIVNNRKTVNGRGRGFRLQDVIGTGNIQTFQLIPDTSRKFTFEDVKKKLYDNITWTSLKQENFEHVYEPARYEFRNIKNCFDKSQLEEIRLAFENKTKISVHRDGIKRDYSVHTQIDEKTGEFQAFFNSEYHMCGNGDYFLLLNPTTAVFMEHD